MYAGLTIFFEEKVYCCTLRALIILKEHGLSQSPPAAARLFAIAHEKSCIAC
jgi:hypothetical protein